MKVAVGEDFIITPPYASRRMASWSRKEAVFPPLPVPDSWTYAPRKFRPTSSLAARRVRAERHNPYSITTLRIQLARFLLKQFVCCPYSCSRRL